MTCIIGIAEGGKVYIGGDSAGVYQYSISVRADTKVFTLGPYVFGFAGSFRMGQLLHHTFAPKSPPSRGLDRFMVAQFIPGVMDCLKTGKWLTNSDGNRSAPDSAFLVGVNGRVFCVDSDFQVGETLNEYTAIGCGEDIAFGSLHGSRGLPPRTRIRKALAAAEHHSAGVTGPFVIKSN